MDIYGGFFSMDRKVHGTPYKLNWIMPCLSQTNLLPGFRHLRMMVELCFRLSKGEELCVHHFTLVQKDIYTVYIYNMYVQFVYIESQHRFCHVVRLPHQVEEHPVAPLPPLPLPSHQPAEPAEPVAVKTLKPAEMCQLPSVKPELP